ncbi:NnrS family protein [Caulobacter sp. 1776]|uniref:NnrS family protein n=1 Tax=Caulobacter sp. 1776 TaxID=3156420 RepID=UPI003390F260
MSTASQRRAYGGPALFSYGFRPFFLSGAAWAALAVPLWIWSLLGGPAVAGHRDWHVHEMLFGFLPAIVAGFLTTAVPNWTGRMPVIGRGLAGLWLLWLAGRVAMLLQVFLGPVATIVDAAFPVVFAAVIWREVMAGKNWRNLPVCLMTSLLAAANIAFHLDAALNLQGLGARLALATAAAMLALIGGRITPSFTTNWLRQRGETQLPATFAGIDKAAVVMTPAAGLAWALAPTHPAAGIALMAAGLLNLVRVARWRGLRTLAEPLIAILHVSYAWLGLGLGLLGLSVATQLAPAAAGVHAVSAGAIGVTCLAVMSRATRGHTGRALTADLATVGVFVAINVAAVLRVVAPFTQAAQPMLLILAALFWSLAYGGFVAAYGPMLWGPRR